MTSISDLQPTERLRVYDLVREAGLDVSDWSNYKLPDSPAKNPKYCYEWSFIGSDRVVVCLWHEEMREDSEGIHQPLNYQEKPIQHPDLNAVNKERCWRMDRAFRTAFMKKLPVRVIIVDGPTDNNGDRSVKNRNLDSEPWHIASYEEETGSCRLQRGPSLDRSEDDSHGTIIDDTLADLGFDPALIGRDAAQRIQKTVSGVKRDSAVRRAVLKRSGLACENPACGAKRGYPGFLDVHHILGVEESDRPWTCVALCPNCHREAHAAPDRDKLNLRLLEFARQYSPTKTAK
jgi:hypothetical protein